MAVHHHLIHRPPHAVGAVLADPTRFGEWVVGPARSTPLDRSWPEVAFRIRYSVRLGPWSADGATTVRHGETGRELELETSFKALGTARIFLQLRPWGEEPSSSATSTPARSGRRSP